MTTMESLVRYASAASVAGVCLLSAAPVAVAAQSTDPSAQKSISRDVAPNREFAKTPGSLSEKLDKSNGVIRPKEVDPAIEKKPPPTGTAAVIPPPGSPGGPQEVQPK